MSKQRLTEPQRRHLAELAGIYDEGGTAFWAPAGSAEQRCAEGLARRGLLAAHTVSYSKTQYELTEAGREAVR